MSVVRLASAQTSPSSTVLAVPVEDTEDTDMALSAPAISSNGSVSLLRNRPHHPKPRHPQTHDHHQWPQHMLPRRRRMRILPTGLYRMDHLPQPEYKPNP